MDKKKPLITIKDKKKLIRNILMAIGLLLCSVIGIYYATKNPDDIKKHADFHQIDEICEYATLECYYHNVAEYEKAPDGLYQYGLFQYGYKKFWIEYTGIVRYGVREPLEVNEPDENGVVRVYVPPAEVLDVDVDSKSMTDPIVETGVFTTISDEDESQAFQDAQATMRKNAQSDEKNLKKAHDNTKDMIEQYIVNMGKLIGQEYQVEWIKKEEPKTE